MPECPSLTPVGAATPPSALVVAADTVLAPARILAPGWVAVSGDRIVAVGEGPVSADITLEGQTLAPGFVDAHGHGGAGASFTTGDADEARRVAAGHLEHGTTSLMASLVTGSIDELARSVAQLSPLVHDGTLIGIHLEGPWLSPAFKGAHDPELLAPPSQDDIARLLEASEHTVKMVTIAPELPGGLDAVEQLAAAGVVAAVGHTDADYRTSRAAVEAGATAATHLFNAMRGLHHRDPGPIAALLEAPQVWIELVADGVHVHPAALRLAVEAAGERIVLVTDSMAAAAAPDGDYILGALDVQVRDGVARLVSNGAIAGSTLTLAKAVKFAVTEVGLSLAAAVRAATAAPADMLGLSDVGRLEVGRRADLVALGDDLAVTRVMRAGEWVR